MQPEDVVNNALDLIGHPNRIRSFYDGSMEAQIARDIYAQTRDALLTAKRPDWSRTDIALTLLKSAPNIAGQTAQYNDAWNDTYPPIPWLYEYQYPEDAVHPLQIKAPQFSVPIWRPEYIPFRLNHDADPLTILTNQPNAILTYVFQVIDPDVWHNDFVDDVIIELGKRLSPALAKQMQERQNANNTG